MLVNSYIDDQFAIHANHSLITIAQKPLCEISRTNVSISVVAVLNAAPEFRITHDWIEAHFRDGLDKVIEENCPDAESAVVWFYTRGLDFEVHSETLADKGAGIPVDRFVPYQIDKVEYPTLLVRQQQYGPGLFLPHPDGSLTPVTHKIVSDGYLSAYFSFPERMTEVERKERENRLAISRSFATNRKNNEYSDDFFTIHNGADGSFLSYVNLRNEQYISAQQRAAARREQYLFNVQMVLGLAAAWACADAYQDWCTDIMPAIGSIGPAAK